ncbi:MAG: hypothetical protein HY508_15185 [Acidobacteria bacterium]|nr:hypothetical protein [Acidobacteriota bacterium]
MADVTYELEQVKLAFANVAQLTQLMQDIEARVKGDPEAAEGFIRPCAQLLQKLLEAQGSVETLLEKLFVAGRVEMAVRR